MGFRFAGRVGAVSGFLMAFSLITAQATMAACEPPRTGGYFMSHFSGGVSYSRGGPLTDAEVTIPYYTPWVDFAVGGSVSAWPMLQKSGCPLGLVQVGQGEIFHAYTHNFVEVEQCYYDPLTYNGPVEYVSPIGQTHH
jgi:hypothetical protein